MTTIPDDLIIEGAARAFSRMLNDVGDGSAAERIVTRIAELRSELLTTAEAAELLRCSTKTLLARHVEWGLSKSLLLGDGDPRFFRSQIMERAHAREVKGRAPANVAQFPKTERKAG
jgi:hypothetical protein